MGRAFPQETEMVRMLAKVPLFSGLSESELSHVAKTGHEVKFESGETVMKQGEPGLGFLLILEGKVEVRKGNKKIATTEAGGFFGEMAVFDDKPRSADVVAVTPTRCFAVPQWSVFPMLSSNPSIAVGIIRELVRRLRQVSESPHD